MEALLGSPFVLLARVIALLVAISVHEFAHAFAADRLGDPTPREEGRLTLNPFSHLSLTGALFLILFRFGWSKPVPVNAYNFQNPRQGMLVTALAGPASNFLVAAIAAAFLRIAPDNTHLPLLLSEMILLNLVLMVFNLIPIPPLDGSRILPFLFRGRGEILAAIEQQGFFLLFGLIVFDALAGGRILGTLIGIPVTFLAQFLLGGSGLL